LVGDLHEQRRHALAGVVVARDAEESWWLVTAMSTIPQRTRACASS
jgi:hypothetical protein